MRRRDFIKVVSAGILAWPLAARGQQSGKTWRLGFIAHRYESFYDGLFEGLRELGYVEGQNLIIERRLLDLRLLMRNSAQSVSRYLNNCCRGWREQRYFGT